MTNEQWTLITALIGIICYMVGKWGNTINKVDILTALRTDIKIFLDEYIKTENGKCVVRCIGRITASQLIEGRMDQVAIKHTKVREEKERIKALQNAAKEMSEEDKTLCETCHVWASCPDRDDTLETCEKHVPRDTGARPCFCPDCGVGVEELHKDGCDIERCSFCYGQYISCDCSNNDDLVLQRLRISWNGEMPDNTQAVTAENVKAAESAPDDLTQLANSLKDGDKIPFKRAEGFKYVGSLTDMGFTEEEVKEINWAQSGDALYGAHPNHPPVKIQDGKMTLITPDYLSQKSTKAAESVKIIGLDENHNKVEMELKNPRHESTKRAAEKSIGHDMKATVPDGETKVGSVQDFKA